MTKSASNKLAEDGLTTLKYTLEREHAYPLYTWLLVRLPPAPPKRPPSFWEKTKGSLWGGMNKLAGGFGKVVAEKMQTFAASQDEAEETRKNHVY